MYIPLLAPSFSLLTTSTFPPPHPPAEQNVTAYLYTKYPGPPSTVCHNLREGMCCGASDPHTYPRVEFVGLTPQDTAIGWGTRADPNYGFCGDVVVATAKPEPAPPYPNQPPKYPEEKGKGGSRDGAKSKAQDSGDLETPTSRTSLAKREKEEKKKADITVLTATPGRLSAVSWESQRERVGHEDEQRRGIWSMVWRGKMRIGLRRSEIEMAPEVWERPRAHS